MINGNIVKIVGAFISSMWASLGFILQSLLMLMGIDILLGVLVAIMKGTLDTHISFIGIIKKCIILLVILAVYIGFRAASLTYNLPYIPIPEATVGYFLVHEVISIVNNADKVGIPIPAFLRKALCKIKKVSDGQ